MLVATVKPFMLCSSSYEHRMLQKLIIFATELIMVPLYSLVAKALN